MNSSIKNRIKLVFTKNKITPIKFIQGDDSFNFLKKTKPQRVFYKKSTAIFEGVLNNKPVIVKIYVNLKNNKLRFEREKYCYSKLTIKYPEISHFFPQLYLSKTTPFPFLVLEKISYPPLGDWYFMRKDANKKAIKASLEALKKIHKTAHLPKRLSYPKFANPNNFFKKNKKIEKSLSKYPSLHKTWEVLKKQQKKFKRLYSKTGFIFSDLSPSNILTDNSQVKFIDLETVSTANIFYDLATFSFSSISKSELFSLTTYLIHKIFISKKEDLYLFKFFLLWYILFNIHFIPTNPFPYLNLAKELTKEFLNNV